MLNEKAYRLDEISKVGEMVETLATVDFSGPYDDRRPFEAMRSWLETRRIELEAEDGST